MTEFWLLWRYWCQLMFVLILLLILVCATKWYLFPLLCHIVFKVTCQTIAYDRIQISRYMRTVFQVSNCNILQGRFSQEITAVQNFDHVVSGQASGHNSMTTCANQVLSFSTASSICLLNVTVAAFCLATVTVESTIVLFSHRR